MFGSSLPPVAYMTGGGLFLIFGCHLGAPGFISVFGEVHVAYHFNFLCFVLCFACLCPGCCMANAASFSG